MNIFSMIGGLITDGIGYFRDKQAQKHETAMAVEKNKQRLAESDQTHNQAWEMKQLDNSGWKDDVLFYAWIGLMAYSAIDPEGSKVVFQNWSALPDWFLEVSGWIIGAVIGVRKLGDSLPSLISGCVQAVKNIKK